MVTRPVHTTAAATLRMLGSRSRPGSVETVLVASSYIQPSSTRPSPSAQTAQIAAVTAHCAAVIGSACRVRVRAGVRVRVWVRVRVRVRGEG